MAFFHFFEFVSPSGLFKFFIKISLYLIFIVNALGNYKKILHVENEQKYSLYDFKRSIFCYYFVNSVLIQGIHLKCIFDLL